MDVTVWLLLAGIVAVILAVATFIQRRFGPESPPNVPGPTARPEAAEPEQRERGVAGRQGQSRNVRARVAALRRARGEGAREAGPGAGGGEEEIESGDEGANAGHVEELVEEMLDKEEKKVGGGKIGTKKLRRIQEKAERKAAREQEEALREDRKKREALREEERQRELEEEKQRQQREEEEERKRKEEEERREQEEYLRLKEAFSVEEEGVDFKDDETEARGVSDFINYIKRMKVVYMEDLAAEFDLKTQEAIARVQSLQENGELSGVVDDRGKFIYISDQELQAVADFIKQRGRVSIAELVSSSNRLINLQPDSTVVT